MVKNNVVREANANTIVSSSKASGVLDGELKSAGTILKAEKKKEPAKKNLGNKKDKLSVEIGLRLEELRKKKNLKQTQVAEVLFIESKNYGKYERGETRPPYEAIIKLAKLYNVSLGYIITGSKIDSGEEVLVNIYRNCPTDQRERLIKSMAFLVTEIFNNQQNELR